jgi:hypothetical protein
MLVDPELAERARELLREPCETNGKGWHMSALGTHEITAGMGLGLEPPLSPPVVRGPSASMPMPAGDGLSELPTPPPAIRPPESAIAAPQPAPAPQAEVPQQPEPEQVPAAQPELVVAPEPVAAPEPVQLQPEPPAAALEPELPTMAPAEEPVLDYFAPPEPAAEAVPAIASVEEIQESPAEETPAEPVQLTEVAPMPAQAPAVVAQAPAVEEAAAELPTMAPPEPDPVVEAEPVAVVAPQPVEVMPEAEVQPEPEPEVEPEPEAELTPEPELVVEPAEAALPVLEPLADLEPIADLDSIPNLEPIAVPEPIADLEPIVVPEPVSTSELEELFAPKRSGQFCVVVRLKEGNGVEVGSFRDFGTAMEGAQEVIEQFSTASEGQWPFYAGRFIRPDLIVSVDVVEGDQH